MHYTCAICLNEADVIRFTTRGPACRACRAFLKRAEESFEPSAVAEKEAVERALGAFRQAL